MEDLKITCKLSLKDYYSFYMTILWPMWIAFALFILSIIISGIFDGDPFLKYMVDYFVSEKIDILLFLGVFILVTIWFPICTYKRDNSLQLEYTCRFTEEKIETENERGNSFFFYTEVRRVKKLKRLLIVNLTSRKSLLIPISKENQEICEKIFAFLNEKCGKKK